MLFPDYRPRRMRRNEAIRRLVRENRLTVDDLILPLFVCEGNGVQNPIPSLPGQCHLSTDRLLAEVKTAVELNIPAVLLFGINDRRDAHGTFAFAKDGIVPTAVSAVKNKYPDLVVITDVCLCGYTENCHCGIVKDGRIDNDATLDVLSKIALSHAKAGADIVAPSDMMDGRVAEVRNALDENGFSETAIMSYAVKYWSACYGPFCDACDSAPLFGDRRSYQMDPPNALEAIREVNMDVEEGADILMVKPALAYLDIIYRVREEIDHPLAAYNVSGEYAMVKAAARNGWMDGDRFMLEMLTSIKRAGADMILTYFAIEAARLLQG
jgi:porphobilinogen synthase